MAAAITVENVIQAVETLYNSNDGSAKEAASAWLQEFQNSVEAWTISDQLLHLKLDVNSCYIAAHTMRGKIQHKFLEVPVNYHESLKTSLMSHVNQITFETPHSISTQLCLALSDLCCQMINWKHAVSEIIQTCKTSPHGNLVILNVLIFVPEEVDNYSLRLGQNRRNDLRGELDDQSQFVLSYLHECLQARALFGQHEPRLLELIFKAYASWWKSDLWHESDVIGSPLNDAVLEVLRAPNGPAELQEVATDTMVSIFSSIKHYNMQLFERLLAELQPRITQLSEDYQLALVHDNLDRCLNFCRIFTEMAEALVPRFVQSQMLSKESAECCQLLIDCMGHYSRELCDVTFNFWNLLFEGVRSCEYNSAEPYGVYRSSNRLPEPFLPYISLLLQALVRHCQIEASDDAVDDELKDFRSSVGDLIKDLTFVLQKQTNCIQQVCNWLVLPEWRAVEAALFLLRHLVRGCQLDETDAQNLAKSVLATLARFVDHPHQLTASTVTLIGEIGLFDSEDNLPGYFEFVLQKVGQPQLGNSCVTALTRLLSVAPRKSAVVSLERLYSQVVSKLPVLGVKAVLAEHLFERLAVLFRGPPREEEAAAFSLLTGVCLQELDKMASSSSDVRIKHGCPKSDPAYWLDCISALFRNVEGLREDANGLGDGAEVPLLRLVRQIWPCVLRVMERYLAKVHVMERATRTVRFFFRALRLHMRPLLETIATKLVDLYYRSQHSCLLYLGGVMVDTFGVEKSTHPGLKTMFMAYFRPTCTLLDGEGLQQNPGTVEDLFRLCTRMVQRCSGVMGPDKELLREMVLLAIKACEVRQADALDACTFFLKVVLACDHDQNPEIAAPMHSLVFETDDTQSLGFLLVHKILHSLCNGFPSSLLKDVASIFYVFWSLDRERFARWFELTVKELPLVRADGNVQVTDQQLEGFRTALTGQPRHAQDISDSMKRFGRLFR